MSCFRVVVAVALLLVCAMNKSLADAAAVPASGWVLLNENQGGLLLVHDRKPIAKIGAAMFGQGWVWKGFGKGSDQIVEGALEQPGAVEMGPGQRIDRVLRVEPHADGSVAIRLSVVAPEGATVHAVMLQVKPEKAFAAGGKLLGAAGEAISLTRGALSGPLDQLKLVTAGGDSISIDAAGYADVSSDGEVRFGLTPPQMAPEKQYQATLTLRAASPVVFVAARDGAYTGTDTSGWFPYPVGVEGTPVDLSFLNKDAQGKWKPAGEHGFLKVAGERFVFDDGTEARFWGVNVAARAALADDARAEQIASRLARLGVNVVRLHHLDSPWSGLTLYDRKHASGTTSQLDADALAKLDKLIFELKRRGIYVVLSPWVGFQVRPGDGIRDSDQFPEGSWSLHPYVYFDPAIQSHLQEYLKQVWTHVNPHTGLAYKDDPAIILTETINEGMLQRGGGHVKVASYRKQFIELYEQWARDNGRTGTLGDAVIDRNYEPEAIDFYRYQTRNFYKKMDRFFDEIGVRVPRSYNNWYMWAWELEPQADAPFVEVHHYYGGDSIGAGNGLGGVWPLHAPTERKSPWGPIAGAALAGKPLFVSECGHNPPKIGRAAYFPALAAMSGFQGWDAITGYAYSQSPKSAPGYDNFSSGAYSWETDPAVIAGLAAGSVIFRQEHVRPAEQTVVMQITDDELHRIRWEEDGRLQHANLPAFNRAIDQHRVVVVFGDQIPNDLHPSRVIRVNEDALAVEAESRATSDTGQLWRDWKTGVAAIDAPLTQAAMGTLAELGTAVELSVASFETSTPDATLVLSSLSTEPVESSARLMLTAVAAAEPVGLKVDYTGRKIVNVGEPPMMAEPVRGKISWKTSREKLYALPVLVNGTHAPAIEIPIKDGRATLVLGGQHPALFYQVVDDVNRAHIEAADRQRRDQADALAAAQSAYKEAEQAFTKFTWAVKPTDRIRELQVAMDARRDAVLAADAKANYHADREFRALQTQFEDARREAARADARGAELWNNQLAAEQALAQVRSAMQQ